MVAAEASVGLAVNFKEGSSNFRGKQGPDAGGWRASCFEEVLMGSGAA